MSHREKLHQELEEQFLRIASKQTSPIGSLVFWSDDYGAHLFFSQWKLNDFSWSVKNDNTISIDAYEADDGKVLCQDVSLFFESLEQTGLMSELALRDGFQFGIAFYSDPPNAIGEALEGIPDPDMDLAAAIPVVDKYTALSFSKAQSSPLGQISFSSEEGKSVIELTTDAQLCGDAFEYHYHAPLELGLALTLITATGEPAFEQLIEQISQQDYFQAFPKKATVQFQVIGKQVFIESNYTTNKDPI